MRLSVVESSPLMLAELDEDEVVIIERGVEVARGSLEKPLFHCPRQAYITVSERCIYDCKFCAVPKLSGGVKSKEKVERMVAKAWDTGELEAISLTSGVERSAEEEVARVAEIIGALRRFDVPIGVSVTPALRSSEILKAAGADEIKYNVECLDPELFRRVCPGVSLEKIKMALLDAVSHFGKNRVFSNVIIGLGESDRALREGIEELAEMGVLPVIRAVYPHPLRRGEIEMIRPSPERLIDLAHYTKKVLEDHGLRGDLAETGCYRCTGCDLVPHMDL
ncbi:MAG: radical SAM protein [Methanothrix sp.]|nr:radical SAM protein [Methanothrix sp.]MDD3709595.1 radical SAM protein [Methanothrix sp.]MDD5768054.1 radical SAM protein [Methanothrix sp.]